MIFCDITIFLCTLFLFFYYYLKKKLFALLKTIKKCKAISKIVWSIVSIVRRLNEIDSASFASIRSTQVIETKWSSIYFCLLLFHQDESQTDRFRRAIDLIREDMLEIVDVNEPFYLRSRKILSRCEEQREREINRTHSPNFILVMSTIG